MFPFGHHKIYALAHFHLVAVEGTCAQEHTEHIIGAIFPFVIVPLRGLLVALIEHLERHLVVGISVPYFLYAFRLALEGILFIIKRNEVERGVTRQSVAHRKVFVGRARGAGSQRRTIGGLLAVDRLRNIERGCADLEPYEFPIEVEVVDQSLATLECRVFTRTLGRCSVADRAGEAEEGQRTQKVCSHCFGVLSPLRFRFFMCAEGCSFLFVA